ncbi:hypothetical protein NLI96_g5370 [Meripilus lineatus]|uniref:Cytochrome P450 n=1 Tax=Meripilus lineatus TaxID=2056292 RepID=A0AAD5V8F8_9APHY|nr:hypothetical protein NLI96_g5370 [Physisporinus lineatus]
MPTLLPLVATLCCLFILQRCFQIRKILRTIHYQPCDWTFFSLSGLGGRFPRIPFILPGRHYNWRKHQDFKALGSDIFVAAALAPTVSLNYQLADPDAIKEVIGSRVRFPKPIELYKPILFFGDNVVASEHDQWKRHRKISAPAFTEPNNKLVWHETIHVINDLFDNVWGNRDEIAVDHIREVFMPTTLFVISAAAFGRRITWNDEVLPPPGSPNDLQVSHDYLYKLILPNWAMGLTQRLRQSNVAFDELERYMVEMIRDRKNQTSDDVEPKYDLLNGLLDACEGDLSGDSKLTERELLGNIFVFLLAVQPEGNEVDKHYPLNCDDGSLGSQIPKSTGHTLCFAFALLALYPQEQERLYEEIITIFPDGRLPTYEDANSLVFANAILNETLRMFPPVPGIPKYSAEDTVLPMTNSFGEKVLVPVPKGSNIILQTAGLHYNPKYWPDPHTFKPSRFLGNWPRDAFLPFSGGVRSCLGRRFAELESIVTLTMFISKYRVGIKDEPQFAGETFEQKKERVLDTIPRLTLTPVRIPLVFKRR